jgi:hypothetical protein
LPETPPELLEPVALMVVPLMYAGYITLISGISRSEVPSLKAMPSEPPTQSTLPDELVLPSASVPLP